MSAWSRPRVKAGQHVAPHWNFTGLPVGLIGYRSEPGKWHYLGVPAFCEWNRREFSARPARTPEGGQ